MEGFIRRSDAIEAVQKCCPENAMYRAIRDVPSVEAVQISQEDFGTLCVCALRYCHGRRTYMPDLVQSIVKAHFKDLSDKDLGVIANDEQFQASANLWGDPCDKTEWQKFYEALKDFRGGGDF